MLANYIRYFNEMCQVTVWYSPVSHPSLFANTKMKMDCSVESEKFMREMKMYNMYAMRHEVTLGWQTGPP